jgi:hypothetical protein
VAKFGLISVFGGQRYGEILIMLRGKRVGRNSELNFGAGCMRSVLCYLEF